jgi:hypothetical protein
MIPQARDEEIVEFIRNMGVVTASQIQRLFFPSINSTRARMQKLYKSGLVKVSRDDPASPNIYWIEGKKPIQLDHRLLVTEIYVHIKLMNKGTLKTWEREPQWGNLRPDAWCIYSIPYGDRLRQCNRCFEVERFASKPFNQQKYEDFYNEGSWKDKLNVNSFPKICIVTDKKVQIEETNNHISYVVIPTNLQGLESVF